MSDTANKNYHYFTVLYTIQNYSTFRQTRGGGSAVPVVLTGANKRALEEGKDNGDEGAKRQAGGNWRGGSNGRGGRGGNHTPGKK